MIFIVILIALLIERFFDWGHLRQWSWFAAYQHLIMRRFPKGLSYANLIILLVPLLIIVFLVSYLIKGWAYGLITFLFQLFILLYCLGPKNLWADVFSCINAFSQTDPNLAANKLKATFGITDSNYGPSLQQNFLDNIFIEFN